MHGQFMEVYREIIGVGNGERLGTRIAYPWPESKVDVEVSERNCEATMRMVFWKHRA